MAVSYSVAREYVAAPPSRQRWGWVEVYVAVLFLSSGLLLVPGASALRAPIRALPYLASLALLFYFDDKRRRSGNIPAQTLLLGALLLYAINLFHPTTDPRAGVAQVIFQISVAAPLWWASKAVESREHLDRLLWVILAVNGLNALVGLLQVFYPARFMPPELSAAIDPAALAQMSYSVGGRAFIRPPGLSDLPGGAALSAMVAGFLGIAFGVRERVGLLVRGLCLSTAAVGIVVLLLTSARTFVLTMFLALVVLFVMVVRQGRGKVSLLILTVSALAVVATYQVAVRIGGPEVVRRFSIILESGLVDAYASNRGMFLQHTFEQLLPRYPMGAGLGRWGMMRGYFGSGDPKYFDIWVEVQLTGWLLDGGVLMWLLYGGAMIAAIVFALDWVLARADRETTYLAVVVLGVLIMVAVSSLSGPTFNSPVGVFFWLITGALLGAVGRPSAGGVESSGPAARP